jgi:hypothetical protein
MTKLANPKKAKILAGFFKTGKGQYGEGDKFLGIVVPQQREVAREYYKQAKLSDTANLLRSPYHEHRLTALIILTLKFPHASEKEQKQIDMLTPSMIQQHAQAALARQTGGKPNLSLQTNPLLGPNVILQQLFNDEGTTRVANKLQAPDFKSKQDGVETEINTQDSALTGLVNRISMVPQMLQKNVDPNAQKQLPLLVQKVQKVQNGLVTALKATSDAKKTVTDLSQQGKPSILDIPTSNQQPSKTTQPYSVQSSKTTQAY